MVKTDGWPGCEDVDLRARVSLLPDAMSDIRGHIRSMLLSLRMRCAPGHVASYNDYSTVRRYHVSIEGVILAIPKVRIEAGTSHGLIIGAEPHIHFDVRATARVSTDARGLRVLITGSAQIFRPREGLNLVGVVKQVQCTHAKFHAVGCAAANDATGCCTHRSLRRTSACSCSGCST